MKLYYAPGMIMPAEHNWETKAMAGFHRSVVYMTPAEIAGLALAYKDLQREMKNLTDLSDKLTAELCEGDMEGSFVGDHLRGL